MKARLHNLIFAGMVVGIIVGVALWWMGQRGIAPGFVAAVLWWLDLLGPTIFIGALKMIIAPLILASIVTGVTSLPDLRELGSIGWKTFAYYFLTSTLAVAIGLLLVLTLQPGRKPSALAVSERRAAELVERRTEFEAESGSAAIDAGGPTTAYLAWLDGREGAVVAGGSDADKYAKLRGAASRGPGDVFKDDIVRPLLSNPFTALAADPPNALGIIFFALLLGIACSAVGRERAGPVIRFFHGLNDVIMRVTHWLMSISPVAIGCIIAKLVADNSPEVFKTLGWYCGTVIGGIGIHIVLLATIAAVIGGVGPLALWRGLREAWMIAFTTRSSAATLPVTIENVKHNLNVSPKVANFSLPIGATMNMDGTALYEGVAVIFLLQIYGGMDDVAIATGFATTLVVFVTAVLASVGAAAVPNAGLVTMVLVAGAVGLPIYYIPLIFAVDAMLDMFRTSTNVLGDSVGALVVDRLERRRGRL